MVVQPEDLDVDAIRLELARWLTAGNENVKRGYTIAMIRDLAQAKISALENEQSMLELIQRVVTGDGQQLENLSMSDDEWQQAFEGQEYVEITMRKEDWLALVRLARKDGE